MSVPPMKRLIDRSEFEKRLADYSQAWLKAFKALLKRNEELEARILELEASKRSWWKVGA